MQKNKTANKASSQKPQGKQKKNQIRNKTKNCITKTASTSLNHSDQRDRKEGKLNTKNRNQNQ